MALIAPWATTRPFWMITFPTVFESIWRLTTVVPSPAPEATPPRILSSVGSPPKPGSEAPLEYPGDWYRDPPVWTIDIERVNRGRHASCRLPRAHRVQLDQVANVRAADRQVDVASVSRFHRVGDLLQHSFIGDIHSVERFHLFTDLLLGALHEQPHQAGDKADARADRRAWKTAVLEPDERAASRGLADTKPAATAQAIERQQCAAHERRVRAAESRELLAHGRSGPRRCHARCVLHATAEAEERS